MLSQTKPTSIQISMCVKNIFYLPQHLYHYIYNELHVQLDTLVVKVVQINISRSKISKMCDFSLPHFKIVKSNKQNLLTCTQSHI